MKHKLVKINKGFLRVRDLGKVQCLNCHEVFSYSLRSTEPIELQLDESVLICNACENKQNETVG